MIRAHTIRGGETLSGIAEHYKFHSHEPIWIFNTEMGSELANCTEDNIPAGKRIAIPRKADEYDKLVASLITLRNECDVAYKGMISENVKNKDQAQAVGARVDLAADVIFIVKGGVKTTAKLGSKRLKKYVATKTVVDVAQTVLMHNLPEYLDEHESHNETIRIMIDSGSSGLVDNTAHIMARKATSNRIENSIGNSFVKSMKKEGVAEATNVITRALDLNEEASAISELSAMVTDFLMDGLDAVNPSGVAKTYIRLMTGESPMDTYIKSQKHIERMRVKGRISMDARIKRLREEKQRLYS